MKQSYRQVIDLLTRLSDDARDLTNVMNPSSKIIDTGSVSRSLFYYNKKLVDLLEFCEEAKSIVRSRLDPQSWSELYNGVIKNMIIPQTFMEARYYIYHDFHQDSFQVLSQFLKGNRSLSTENICKQLCILYAAEADVKASLLMIEYIQKQIRTQNQ